MDDTEIQFYTPGPADAAFPYHVVAAGRTLARPGEAPVRKHYNQHVLILTQGGTGTVEVQGRRWGAGPGTLVWLDTGRDYAHRAARGTEGWRYLWVGAQGFGLDALCARMGIAADPVTQVADAAHVAELIGGILDRLRGRGQGLGAHTSSAVASLVAAVHDARAHRVAPKGSGRPDVSDWLLPRLRANLARHWNITILADEAGLSPSQLHRVFRLETGLSPMSWLRRERITAAKLLLVQPGLSVQRVAETVGYADPFHFSRDFRTLTGLSPRQFRNTLGP